MAISIVTLESYTNIILRVDRCDTGKRKSPRLKIIFTTLFSIFVDNVSTLIKNLTVAKT